LKKKIFSVLFALVLVLTMSLVTAAPVAAVPSAAVNGGGIFVTPTSGLLTTEAGGPDTFIIVLTSAPSADVTIDLSSSDPTEGLVTPASVIFTSTDWNAAQTVTVTGVGDDVDDGDIAYTIGGLSDSDDTLYDNKTFSVSMTNTDDDTASITVTPTSGLGTTEDLDSDTFTIVLDSEPIADVTIGLSSSDTSEGTVSSASVIFTSANWATPQEVTVTGVDDPLLDGDVAYTIDGLSDSTDTLYDNLTFSVSVTNTDNESGINVSAISGPTTEGGDTATFTIVLNTQPSYDVTIGLISSDPTEGLVTLPIPEDPGPAIVTFTTTDWATPQEVTVTGVDDPVSDGDIPYTIDGTSVSTDEDYDTLTFSVSVTNLDVGDVSGITVTPTSGLVTTEDLDTDTFTIELDSEPTANVTIGLSSSDTSEGTVSSASVIFTPGDWNEPQTVNVTGVDDYVLDGNIVYSIITVPAVSADPNYGAPASLNASDVSVINNDNEEWGTITIILTEIAKIQANLDSGGTFYTFVDEWFTTIKTAIDDIKAKTDTIVWSDITDIKTEVTNIEAKLDVNGTFYTFVNNWFTTIKTASDAIKAKTDTIVWSDITSIQDELANTTYGLSAIKTAIDDIEGGGGGVASANDTDVSITRNAARVIIPISDQAFWGQLTVQSTRSGYNIEVWDGDSWLPVVPSGTTAHSVALSGFGLRLYNDTYSTITVDYVFVSHSVGSVDSVNNR